MFVGQVLAGFAHHFGDAEVSKHHASIGRDQDVPGFHIAVDETILVRVIQSGSNCCTNVNGELGRQFLFFVQHLTQAHAFDKLHNDCLAPVFNDCVIHLHDVWMTESTSSYCFATKALNNNRILCQLRLK